MDLVDNPELIKELVFLEIWETGLLPAVSGAIRVRQLMRADPGAVARYRSLKTMQLCHGASNARARQGA
jgi:hypothetical protein